MSTSTMQLLIQLPDGVTPHEARMAVIRALGVTPEALIEMTLVDALMDTSGRPEGIHWEPAKVSKAS